MTTIIGLALIGLALWLIKRDNRRSTHARAAKRALRGVK